MKITDLQKSDWIDLVDRINDQSCILLLGPNLYKDQDKNVLQDVLYKQLRNKYEEDLFDFFPEDGFFVPKENDIINEMRIIVKKYYRQNFPDQNLKNIIQIPFHCMISLTPDMLLKRCFDRYGIATQFERFSMTQPVNQKLLEASKDNPLLYNVFGSIDEDETIILTHNHFFNYLKNIIGDERLPAQLRRAIDKATDLIFLGFSFEKWWIQLLMRLLGLHVFPGRNRWAIDGEKDNSFSKIAKKEFKIKFIEDDADLFLQQLFDQYSSTGGALRSLNLKTQEVENVQKEITSKRVAELMEQIKTSMNLRNEYEDIRITSPDPKETQRCNMEIEKLNKEINEKTLELQSLK
jgi:hypothetical protein